VKKHALTHHLSGKVHAIALEYAGPLNPTSSEDPASSNSRQPRIDASISNVAKVTYEKLFRTAYKVATDGLPLKAYTSMVNLQRENGMQLLKGG
jgi:hypothetical protein